MGQRIQMLSTMRPTLLAENPSSSHPRSHGNLSQSMQVPPTMKQRPGWQAGQELRLIFTIQCKNMTPSSHIQSRSWVQGKNYPPSGGTHCHRHRAYLGPPGWTHPVSSGHCSHPYSAKKSKQDDALTEVSRSEEQSKQKARNKDWPSSTSLFHPSGSTLPPHLGFALPPTLWSIFFIVLIIKVI